MEFSAWKPMEIPDYLHCSLKKHVFQFFMFKIVALNCYQLQNSSFNTNCRVYALVLKVLHSSAKNH